MIYINDEQKVNDEQKAQLEEFYNNEREAINILIEEGNTEVLLEKIRFYSELIEMMARALVNKTKE